MNTLQCTRSLLHPRFPTARRGVVRSFRQRLPRRLTAPPSCCLPTGRPITQRGARPLRDARSAFGGAGAMCAKGSAKCIRSAGVKWTETTGVEPTGIPQSMVRSRVKTPSPPTVERPLFSLKRRRTDPDKSDRDDRFRNRPAPFGSIRWTCGLAYSARTGVLGSPKCSRMYPTM